MVLARFFTVVLLFLGEVIAPVLVMLAVVLEHFIGLNEVTGTWEEFGVLCCGRCLSLVPCFLDVLNHIFALLKLLIIIQYIFNYHSQSSLFISK